MKSPEEVFPEYYLIRVNAFDKIAETHLEEWIKYLKDGEIADDTTAPGLQEAKRKLEYMAMSKADKVAYDEHINAVMIQNDVISTAMKEGRAEGRAEGIEQTKLETARNLKTAGIAAEIISQCTGLTLEQVAEL